MTTEIKYQEHNMDEIMRYFAKGFMSRAGEKLVLGDWFYDQHKGVVVFKLMVEAKGEK